ncbi:MAG: bifunctional folylpolyglutamate synthase/dihydrofolate synthase [Allomuricauda sp.]|nr:MAG: bifunctional folylpolyglutamate synthase/dihydrofolate synthase [Allomuricauda sp.]
MTYKETLDWMFTQLPMYQLKGKAALNHKLENIRDFSRHLGDPHENFKSIHVAGTNGKGSSCHMLAAILKEAGYKVGLYTSPHLKDFRERIKVNGEVISTMAVKSFIKHHKSYLEHNKLSFFEMTVGMAFHYFSQEKVDIAIIEVGLGGRLDSTNIITPEVSLITNIGFDHTHILGNTLEKIAFEKAGIIKKNIPAVISERQIETTPVFLEVAAARQAKLVFAEEVVKQAYQTDLLGAYQQKNSKGVVATLNELKNFHITAKHIKNGLQRIVEHTGLLGRWQQLQRSPTVVCDTAHNPQGIQMVMHQISLQPFENLHIVLGLVDDKKLDAILSCFPKEARYYFVTPNIPRGLAVDKLEKEAVEHGLIGKSYTSVGRGLRAALTRAAVNDFVFVGGSTFVVAEVV